MTRSPKPLTRRLGASSAATRLELQSFTRFPRRTRTRCFDDSPLNPDPSAERTRPTQGRPFVIKIPPGGGTPQWQKQTSRPSSRRGSQPAKARAGRGVGATIRDATVRTIGRGSGLQVESFCLRREHDARLVTVAAVRDLKRGIQEELERERHEALVKSERKMKRVAGAGGRLVLLMLWACWIRFAGDAGVKSRQVASSPVGGWGGSSSFGDRAKSGGGIIEVLNDHLDAAKGPPSPDYSEARIKLTAASDQKKMAYKPLAMKLSEASEILDDRIDDFASLVQHHHALDDSALGNAAAQGTTEIVAVGRVASDAVVDDGRLNAASLVLETSRRTGMGFRVALNMDAIPCWSVFPGQIVALKGRNASGHEFVVSEVLDIPLLPGAASSASALVAARERLRGGKDDVMDPAPLSIVFASGPYTADDNLDYEPLHALCSRAADGGVDALVLTGPFLDVDHPLVATGDFDLPEGVDPDTASLTTVFRCFVAPALVRLASSRPQLSVVLVPSVRDVLAKHVSWPQDAFPRRELGLPRTVRIVTNPMTLSLNEMLLAVSSQDVLYQLRRQELSRAAHRVILWGGFVDIWLSRALLSVVSAGREGVLPKCGVEGGLPTGSVLDVGYIKLGEMVNVRPDVMLVPSVLPPFVKVSFHLSR
ncbi:DNA polymerase alpha subunit B [Ophiocordyceps camponoti-floridani]|uniref:DNA polymerase alpha subunit B n=1 Tax=Ophiocordyceps camponoti-floridani TaxID=2030778 RepID=A0A8H4VAG4_9HYPO|nr:DNA polymerase alpha subunit B [Ophiocordyceps camponoti-floridani]